MSLYIPKLYDNNIDALNILSLCFKYLLSDIKKIIYKYLLIESHGFALFEYKDYGIYNNTECIGTPIEPLIKFISKYCNNTSSIEFNNILNNINNVGNYKKIDLTEILIFLKKINNNIFFEILDFEDLLLIINSINLKINLSILKYTKINNNIFKERIYSISDYIIIPNNDKCLESLIIEKSKFNIIQFETHQKYEKYLFNNNNIITFEILRLSNDNELNFNIIKIPKILNLPKKVFYSKKYIYELIGVILIDEYNGYSLIMKTNNKFYHHLTDKILLVDDEYYEQFINKHCIRLFYKII